MTESFYINTESTLHSSKLPRTLRNRDSTVTLIAHHYSNDGNSIIHHPERSSFKWSSKAITLLCHLVPTSLLIIKTEYIDDYLLSLEEHSSRKVTRGMNPFKDVRQWLLSDYTSAVNIEWQQNCILCAHAVNHRQTVHWYRDGYSWM